MGDLQADATHQQFIKAAKGVLDEILLRQIDTCQGMGPHHRPAHIISDVLEKLLGIVRLEVSEQLLYFDNRQRHDFTPHHLACCLILTEIIAIKTRRRVQPVCGASASLGAQLDSNRPTPRDNSRIIHACMYIMQSTQYWIAHGLRSK